METEELRKQLITGLKNTSAEKVHIKASQAIQVLGAAKAEEMAFYVTDVQEAPMTRMKRNSAIQQEKLVSRDGSAGFNRLALLKELEGATAQNLPSTGQREPSKDNALSERRSSARPKDSADPATGS